MKNKDALSAELEPIFYTRTAAQWEEFLLSKDVACVRADEISHVRFLHEDPQPKVMGFMAQSQSREFLAQSPGGRYWRHAPVVKFSATPCEPGKSYDGQGAHTRQVLESLGYDAKAIERLARDKVVGLPACETETA